MTNLPKCKGISISRIHLLSVFEKIDLPQNHSIVHFLIGFSLLVPVDAVS